LGRGLAGWSKWIKSRREKGITVKSGRIRGGRGEALTVKARGDNKAKGEIYEEKALTKNTSVAVATAGTKSNRTGPYKHVMGNGGPAGEGPANQRPKRIEMVIITFTLTMILAFAGRDNIGGDYNSCSNESSEIQEDKQVVRKR